jgi:cytochrome bd-type quinol oxidase subunit 2
MISTIDKLLPYIGLTLLTLSGVVTYFGAMFFIVLTYDNPNTPRGILYEHLEISYVTLSIAVLVYLAASLIMKFYDFNKMSIMFACIPLIYSGCLFMLRFAFDMP